MAAKFRKIDPRIWTDEGFIRLDTEAKALTFWLLTARVNRCGIVQWSPALASEETGIPRDRVETVYPTVCDTLHWVRDEVSRTVFLARWWRYNAPDNPSAMQGFLDDLHDIPKNSLKPALIAASDDLKGKVREVYLAKLDTVYPTVSGTVLPQEKEKEKEKDSFFAVSASGPPREKKQPRKEAAPRKPNPLFDAIAEVAGADPSLPATASRIGKITADLAKASPPYTPDEVREFGRRFLEFGVAQAAVSRVVKTKCGSLVDGSLSCARSREARGCVPSWATSRITSANSGRLPPLRPLPQQSKPRLSPSSIRRALSRHSIERRPRHDARVPRQNSAER